jgi:poly(3-hydroxyalkanoate) synthetase
MLSAGLPAASLAECLVEQGFDVYLLDWGSPGGETRTAGN